MIHISDASRTTRKPVCAIIYQVIIKGVKKQFLFAFKPHNAEWDYEFFMNPFKYGTIVSGKDFCGRQALLEQLARHVESAQNVVILGQRRIGKSSAVY